MLWTPLYWLHCILPFLLVVVIFYHTSFIIKLSQKYSTILFHGQTKWTTEIGWCIAKKRLRPIYLPVWLEFRSTTTLGGDWPTVGTGNWEKPLKIPWNPAICSLLPPSLRISRIPLVRLVASASSTPHVSFSVQ